MRSVAPKEVVKLHSQSIALASENASDSASLVIVDDALASCLCDY